LNASLFENFSSCVLFNAFTLFRETTWECILTVAETLDTAGDAQQLVIVYTHDTNANHKW
jgi:hypothetical protein